MVNKPKTIGTAAETAVLRYARTHGFPWTERLTLSGANDRGDLSLVPGPAVIVEVKSGTAAEVASDSRIADWLTETERERINARAHHAFLVTKRRGFAGARAGQWWAHWMLADLPLPIGLWHEGLPPIPVRMHLADALQLIRAAGYGEPLTALEANAA